MIIGVAGTNGAGKGEVVAFLEERGFAAVSLSDIIRQELRDRGEDESRVRMIEVGTELRSKLGEGALAKLVVQRFEAGHSYAVDSIRHPAEVEELRAAGRDFVLLWIDAPAALRFERMRSRGRAGDARSLDEMLELEEVELESKDSSGQQLRAVAALADCRVLNDGSIAQLRENLKEVIGPNLSKIPRSAV